jgi:hypothetical protein
VAPHDGCCHTRVTQTGDSAVVAARPAVRGGTCCAPLHPFLLFCCCIITVVCVRV